MRSRACPRKGPWLAALVILGAVLLTSCAKKAPPSGGPPDVEPPRVVGSYPDSGAAGVPRDAKLSVTFSEGMEPRSSGDAIALAPRVDIRQRRWSGRTVTLVLAEPLRERQTYTLSVGGGARDRHGNTLAGGATVVFTTADTMPRGELSGEIRAHGFRAAGTYLWCYDAATGRQPDSTARDFDALGVADLTGHFRVVGLPVPGRYRLWAFADLNGNRSYEPQVDLLAPADTVLAITTGEPVASGLILDVVNPRAPTVVKGAVIDSAASAIQALGVVAVAANDSTRRQTAPVDDHRAFSIELPAGVWLLRGFRDVDGNGLWNREQEPASDPLRLELAPAGEVTGIELVVRPLETRPPRRQ